MILEPVPCVVTHSLHLYKTDNQPIRLRCTKNSILKNLCPKDIYIIPKDIRNSKQNLIISPQANNYFISPPRIKKKRVHHFDTPSKVKRFNSFVLPPFYLSHPN